MVFVEQVLVMLGLFVDVRRNEAGEVHDVRMERLAFGEFEPLDVTSDDFGNGGAVLIGVRLEEFEFLGRQLECQFSTGHTRISCRPLEGRVAQVSEEQKRKVSCRDCLR